MAEESELREEQEMKDLRASVAGEVFEGKEAPPDIMDEGQEVLEQLSDDAIVDLKEEHDEPDPLAEVKDTLNSLNTRLNAIDGITDRLRKQETHIGNLHKTLKQQEEEKKAIPTPEELELAAKSESAMKELAADYPGVEGLLESLKSPEVEMPDIGKLQEDFESKISTVKQEAIKEVHVNLVASKHPDFWEVSGTREFHDWIDKQDPEVSQRARSTNAIDVVRVLDDFKSQKANGGEKVSSIKESRNRRLESHAKKPVTGKTHKTKSEADWTEAELRASVAREVFNA